MRKEWWKPQEEQRPGSRRVLEAVKLVSQEMSDFEDFDDALREIPAGVLMKGGGSERGGMPMR